MSLSDSIKEAAINNRTTIQSTEAAEIEKVFNKLFYAPKDMKEEVRFVKQVMKRGTDSVNRVGLHASAIIVSEKEFCLRAQVLSLLYEQLQGDNVPVGLKRIFEEGNAIHEKWQRLFIRGGLGKVEDMDFTRVNDVYQMSFTPDAIITIKDVQYVVEIKSVNTFQFKGMVSHPSGTKQLKWYMRLTDIKDGIVLCEDKNTQEFKVFMYHYDDECEELTDTYLSRLVSIQYHKDKMLTEKKAPSRHAECTSYMSKKCQKCAMRDACFNKSRVRIDNA